MKTSKVSYYKFLSALKRTGQVQVQMGKTMQERDISFTVMITVQCTENDAMHAVSQICNSCLTNAPLNCTFVSGGPL